MIRDIETLITRVQFEQEKQAPVLSVMGSQALPSNPVFVLHSNGTQICIVDVNLLSYLGYGEPTWKYKWYPK